MVNPAYSLAVRSVAIVARKNHSVHAAENVERGVGSGPGVDRFCIARDILRAFMIR